jgi:hypothetical protein
MQRRQCASQSVDFARMVCFYPLDILDLSSLHRIRTLVAFQNLLPHQLTLSKNIFSDTEFLAYE